MFLARGTFSVGLCLGTVSFYFLPLPEVSSPQDEFPFSASWFFRSDAPTQRVLVFLNFLFSSRLLSSLSFLSFFSLFSFVSRLNGLRPSAYFAVIACRLLLVSPSSPMWTPFPGSRPLPFPVEHALFLECSTHHLVLASQMTELAFVAFFLFFSRLPGR